MQRSKKERLQMTDCLKDYLIYNVALYLRLSKEDELAGQSESIQNQRNFLTKYVLEQGWNIIDVYIDDGYSGLNLVRVA